MKTIKGLFFDLDGTLVNTLDANSEAYIAALKKLGLVFTREQYEVNYGVRSDVFLKQIFPDITDEQVKQVRRDKAIEYKRFIHLVKPNQQLIDFVKTLRPQHKTALVTMATRENAATVIDAISMHDLFDHIICGDEVSEAKPHPEIYLEALKATGLQADEVLAFEDSDSGIVAATAAGIQTLTININCD